MRDFLIGISSIGGDDPIDRGPIPPKPHTIETYTSKITPAHAGKPKFVATVGATVAPLVDAQAVIASILPAFDLDQAVGAQLDVCGEWIGRSRKIPIPIANAWFSWATPGRGWKQGFWKGNLNSSGTLLDSLDDTTYLRLLRAKILANNSNGRIGSALAALKAYFITPGMLLWLTDRTIAIGQTAGAPNQPTAGPVWELCVAGTLPSVVDLEIMQQQLIPIKPAGVTLNMRVTTVPGAPVFGWGLNNACVAGWGIGAWSASPEYVAQNILT